MSCPLVLKLMNCANLLILPYMVECACMLEIQFQRQIVPEYDRDDVEKWWCNLRPRRLPRGFSHVIVATVYYPPTADDASITNLMIDILSKIENSMPNAAIIIAGDFNRHNVKQIIN